MNIQEYTASDDCFHIHNILEVMKGYLNIPKGCIKWYQLRKRFRLLRIEKDIAKAIEIINQEHLWFHLYPKYAITKKTTRIVMFYKTPEDDPKNDDQYSGIYVFDGKNQLRSLSGECDFYNKVCRPYTGIYMEQYC